MNPYLSLWHQIQLLVASYPKYQWLLLILNDKWKTGYIKQGKCYHQWHENLGLIIHLTIARYSLNLKCYFPFSDLHVHIKGSQVVYRGWCVKHYESENMKQILTSYFANSMMMMHLILIRSLGLRKSLFKSERENNEEKWFVDV